MMKTQEFYKLPEGRDISLSKERQNPLAPQKVALIQRHVYQ